MNIQSIKAVIAADMKILLPNLLMVRQLTNDEAKQPTEWLSHWDNTNRVRITMHEELFTKIKADPKMLGLAVKKQPVAAEGERAAYTRFVVIEPANVEATF